MKKVLDLSEKYSAQLIILLLCVPALWKLGDICSYHTFFYFTDYSTGFGGKKLLGQLCSIWFPSIVRKRHILPLIIGTNISLVALFAWFSGRCISSIEKENRLPLLILLVIYMLSPYSFIGIVNSLHVDFCLAVATLCFLYLYIQHRNTWYYYLFTLVLLVIACLIHHIFCNIYFPLVFALFIYDIFINEEDWKKNVILYFLITLCLFCVFCSISFLSTMNVDFETFYQELQKRTMESIDLSYRPALYYEYYATLSEHVVAYVLPMWKFNIARFGLTLIIFAPLWIVFWIPWILAIRHATNKIEKWCYALMQISLHLLILPAYIMAIDYQRWTFAYCFCQFCLLLVVYSSGRNTLKQQFDIMVAYLYRYKTMTLLVVIYLCSFDLVDNGSAAPIVEQICNMYGLHWQVNEIIP